MMWEVLFALVLTFAGFSAGFLALSMVYGIGDDDE